MPGLGDSRRVSRAASFAAAALAVLPSACVVVPRTVVHYDYECRIVARQMTLESVQVASIGGCSNSGCAAMLVAAGATAAASTVISGTIAVVGNVVYWLEKQGQCARGPDTVPPPLPAPPPARSLL